MEKLSRLRATHPSLDFVDFTMKMAHDALDITYEFVLENDARFAHVVRFADISDEIAAKIASCDTHFWAFLDQLAFQLGIVELFSYWKLACCPVIKISARPLPQAALVFWEKLLRLGMSEFFYVNQIGFTAQNFVKFEINSSIKFTQNNFALLDARSKSSKARALVGFGGGKDSLVTAHLLAQKKRDFAALIVEPASPAALACAQEFKVPIYRVTRRHDPQLLALNQARDANNQPQFFNGHVPFSASLAFIGNLAQLLFGGSEFVVSNEKSACENTTIWRGQPINHQYSKSLEFEQDFSNYCREFLSLNLNYYSYIRDLYEIQVAEKFAQLASEHDLEIFRSCNVGQKKNLWCAKCSKCLFIFIMLFPFLDTQILTTKIFDHNLFEDETLITIFDQLIGLTPSKPLECVGTVEEVRVAGYLAIKKYQAQKLALPPLLAHLSATVIAKNDFWEEKVAQFLGEEYLDNHL